MLKIDLYDGNHVHVGSVPLDDSLVSVDGRTYNFDGVAVTSTGNLNDWYTGVLSAEDNSHPGEKETATTTKEHWEPPCYLEVTNFSKTGQKHTIDHLYVELDMSLSVAQHGDRACNSTWGSVTLGTGGT